MADTAPAQARLGGTDVAPRLQQVLALLFPSNFASKAVLFAVVVALLPLLPTSQSPRIWELPHILLLGLVISYGVFGQRNDEAELASDNAKLVDDDSVESYVSKMMQGPLVFEGNDVDVDNGVHAWSSQYYPDDPLVVVADAGSNNVKGDASEKPLLIPVRKLKPAAEESAAGNVSDSIEEEEAAEEGFLPPKAGGYVCVRELARPSPSSVLDADLTLSPCSPPMFPLPPPPPPSLNSGGRDLRKTKARSFSDYGARNLSMSGREGSHNSTGNMFRSNSTIQVSRKTTSAGYDSVVSFDDQAAAADDELDEMAAAASESSFGSDMVTDGEDDNGNDEEVACNYEEDDDKETGESSCDEELFELATRPGSEEDEVDRKADEFIAKFREQIRMQRVDPGRR